MRLHIIVEGQTEETFVNDTLALHLANSNIATDVHCITTSRHGGRIYRGGLGSYHQIQRDVMLWCKQDHSNDVRFTTMFDYYALPHDFPGYEVSQKSPDPYQRIHIIEDALHKDIADYRFIPYIQLHEFEALLFTGIQHMEWAFIDHEREINILKRIAQKHDNPELINDHPDTAPSKRIIQVIPEYKARKASAGPLVANQIGLTTMRDKCPHFNEWITQLESLGD